MMHPSIRAARHQIAMETVIEKADILGDRFGIPFDAETMQRGNRDPLVATLNRLEAVSDFLSAMVDKTNPQAEIPSESDRIGAMNVDEVKTLIDAVEIIEDLDQFEVAERARERPRVMVLRAIEAKREDMEGEMVTKQRGEDEDENAPAGADMTDDAEEEGADASTADDDRARIEGVDDPESRDGGDGAGMERTESEPR
jgi:hypothetical protein